MIKSTFRTGRIIVNALQRVQMLDMGAWGLSIERSIDIFNETVLEVAKKNFETDKEGFYEPRPVVATTNFKFGASGTFDATSRILAVTMSAAGSARDIGKVVTFFDNSQTPAKGFAGIILDFPATDQYEVAPFFPAPSTTMVTNVTVGDWLVTGDIIRLIQPNEIFSPENIDLYDITNNQVIDVVPYEEFNRRSKMILHNTSTRRWARYMQTKIEFAEGSNAPTLGTLRLSAYWIPPKSTSFSSGIYLSDKRIPELEERLAAKYLSIKIGQIVPQPTVQQAELGTLALHDKQTNEDIAKVR